LPGENYRFDVVGVLVSPFGVRVKHVENAFRIMSVIVVFSGVAS